MTGPLERGYQLLRHEAGACPWPRDALAVTGPDALAYLQGQTSQDLAGLADGQWAWALVLEPQGKLDAFVRARRISAQELVLDTDPGAGEALLARLKRFKLRTKVELALVELGFLAVRGPRALAVGGPTVGFEWGGLSGYDIVFPAGGPVPELPPGVRAVSEECLDLALLEAGFPRHGRELDNSTIPAEAGLVNAAVSFTKGCYTGQELVARIDSRGNNVPKRLCGVVAEGPLQAGWRLFDRPPGDDGAKAVGRLTAAAISPRLGPIALGYLARGTGPGATVWAGTGQAGPNGAHVGPVVQARTCELPF